MREAMFYRSLGNKKVQCDLCHRHCIIPLGERGWCGTRRNLNGRLINLYYGLIGFVTKMVDHLYYHPDNPSLMVGGYGCNFRCPFCFNTKVISKKAPKVSSEEITKLPMMLGLEGSARFISPQELIEIALREEVSALHFDFNEPTVNFEYMYDCGVLAQKSGLPLSFGTNGYMTFEAFEKLEIFVERLLIGFKANASPIYSKQVLGIRDVHKIFEFAERVQRNGKFIEATDTILPPYSLWEFQAFVREFIKHVHKDTPLYIVPYFKLKSQLAGLDAILEVFKDVRKHEDRFRRMGEIAREEGLNFVQVMFPWLTVFEIECPDCKSMVARIWRTLGGITIWKPLKLNDRRCDECGRVIPVITT